MYTIKKEFTFSASHVLKGLAGTHPCSRLHGHNYTVIVKLQSETLDKNGFVQDYRELDAIKQFIDNNLDHRHLNDVPVLEGINPTAENIARQLFKIFKDAYPLLVVISIKETDKTKACFEPNERERKCL